MKQFDMIFNNLGYW